jgi:putative transposase
LRPAYARGLSQAVGAAHKRWADFINGRGRWRGCLFYGRFAPLAIDENHLIAAVRYVALNSVRARLAARAQDWKWSGVCAHLEARDDGLAVVRPVLDRVTDFAALPADPADESGFATPRSAGHTGGRLGTDAFVEGLERVLRRRIALRGASRQNGSMASRRCFDG